MEIPWIFTFNFNFFGLIRESRKLNADFGKLTFTATRYLPPYTPYVGPLDPVTFKEATLFTCIRVH